MSSSVERFDDKARQKFSKLGHTVVHRGELLRHPLYTRFLHWSVSIFFILALLSGFGIYSPWLYRWLTPLFGGGPTTRLLHPWFGLGFDIFFFLQFLNWFAPMTWTKTDSRFMRRIKEYASNQEKLEPEDTGFFNGGQKLYFWTIALSGLLFLLTGVLMWFDTDTNRWLVAISYVIHDIAALTMLAGFIIHVYQSTASEPGTFRSMIGGTVTRAWAWTHHPAWYRQVTGRDPREDYERERRHQSARNRLIAEWERELDNREQSNNLTGREPPEGG